MTFDAIGGYFDLELPRDKYEWHKSALRFQSARAAFVALLLKVKPKAVWLPWFICNDMVEALLKLNIDVLRYGLDDNFCINELINLKKDECILYVNYFGINNDSVKVVLNNYPKNQVIVDNSQAFYAPVYDCLATIYSPRKFFGVPDGGYLYTKLKVVTPTSKDEGSINHLSHLIKRCAFDPESGYQDFQIAENRLSGEAPKQMSNLTQHILSTIDYEKVRARRLENFLYLHDELGAINQLVFKPKDGNVPMCYPFLKPLEGIREFLTKKRIYVSTYWPNIIEYEETTSSVLHSKLLTQNLLPLPCDQRYSKKGLERLVTEIKLYIERLN